MITREPRATKKDSQFKTILKSMILSNIWIIFCWCHLLSSNKSHPQDTILNTNLSGGFNLFENYSSNLESSPNISEPSNTYLKTTYRLMALCLKHGVLPPKKHIISISYEKNKKNKMTNILCPKIKGGGGTWRGTEYLILGNDIMKSNIQTTSRDPSGPTSLTISCRLVISQGDRVLVCWDMILLWKKGVDSWDVGWFFDIFWVVGLRGPSANSRLFGDLLCFRGVGFKQDTHQKKGTYLSPHGGGNAKPTTVSDILELRLTSTGS